MIYPLIERRTSGYDRRRDNSDQRKRSWGQESNSGSNSSNERRQGQERRHLKLDRERLLGVITTNQIKSRWQDIVKSSLIPVVIALASVYVTYQVNQQQIASAKLVANSQLQSAEKIAAANRENSNNIAQAQLKTELLTHMAGISSSIITLLNEPPESYKKTKDKLAQQVKSLSVYGDKALPVLVQLRDEYKRTQDSTDPTGIISTTAAKTIAEILLFDQPIIEMKFVGVEDEPLNLPRRKYINYNLNNSKFAHVNLYGADFSRSSLQDTHFENANLSNVKFTDASLINATFKNTDIADSNFDHANLGGVTFEQIDLANVNFEKAFLEGVKFENCEHIEAAKFPIELLLQANAEPFKSLPDRDYTLLLMHSEKTLLDISEKKASRLENVYKKLNMVDFDALRAKFSELRESMDNKSPDNLLQYTAGLLP